MTDRSNGQQDVATVEDTISQEAIEEAFKDAKKLLEGGADSSVLGTKDKLGVLQRLVTAVLKDDEYRQVLLTAAFDDKREAMLCADAFNERRRYGVQIDSLVDRVIAQCGVKSTRVNAILDAMTRFSLNTSGYDAKRWKQEQAKKSIT